MTTRGIEFVQGLVMSAIVAALAARPVSDPGTAIVVVVHVAVLPLVFWHVVTVASGGTWLPPFGFLGYVALVGAYGYAAWSLHDTAFRWAGYLQGVVALGVVAMLVWAFAGGRREPPDPEGGDRGEAPG